LFFLKNVDNVYVRSINAFTQLREEVKHFLKLQFSYNRVVSDIRRGLLYCKK